MKLFVNNKRIRLVAKKESIKNENYDVLLTAIDKVDLNALNGKVLITNAKNDEIISFLKILEMKKLDKVKTLSFLVNDIKQAEKDIKNMFKIIKAAGGIVIKGDKVLLIHRLGIWDFPKGKLEAGESANTAAVREVEEECGVQAEILQKICSTWHSYTTKDKKVLKKTSWYLMQCTSDAGLKPQMEENIDKLEWMSIKDAKLALNDSYESIRYVFKKYKQIAEFTE